MASSKPYTDLELYLWTRMPSRVLPIAVLKNVINLITEFNILYSRFFAEGAGGEVIAVRIQIGKGSTRRPC